ncbi:MAG: penicillin-binding protein 2 [Vicinamibacterales bacterium]
MIERLRRLSWRQGNKRNPSVGEAAPDWRFTLRRRVVFASAVFALWAVAILTRLVYLQVIEHAEMVDLAQRQQMQTRGLAAKRGDIVDRKGRVLATTVDADTIYAVPSAITDDAATVKQLCAAFRDCTSKERQDLLEKLKQQRHFSYVRRQVSRDVSDRVRALNLEGIGTMKESHREYPNHELAAHVLGFVGIDSKGLSGLESAYEKVIRGKDGQVLVQTDARRHAFSRFERPPTAGATVELTIDEFLQHIAERELRAGVVENRALGGTVIVMDPHSGEILAMANEPTFDPNEYRDADERARRNRAVQDLYEPGSTFKVVTASAAIEERLMPVDTMIDVSGGRMNIGSRVVRDTHDYGVLSFMDVIVKSSNIGAIKIGFKLGTDRLSDYVQKFGFGRPVSPDFPSESPGIVWERTKWTDSALASVSMGYQVGVTPLQMATAVSSVANGGNYVEPRVLRAVYRDGRRLVVKPKPLRQVIGKDTAASMTAIMEQVVDRGTATLAQIPGTRSPARPAPPTSSSTVAIRATRSRRSSASCRRTILSSRSSSCSIRHAATTDTSAVRCRLRSSNASRKRRSATCACRRRSTRMRRCLLRVLMVVRRCRRTSSCRSRSFRSSPKNPAPYLTFAGSARGRPCAS